MRPFGAPSRITLIEIRRAETTDLPAMREVFRRSAMSNDDDRDLLTAHPELQVLSDAGVVEGRTMVALVGDRVLGFASTVEGQPAVELEDLFVDPDWMRQGIGRALVAAIVAAVKAAGGDAVEVDANRHALTFYRHVGFVELGEVAVEYGTAIRMRLSFGAHRDTCDQGGTVG